MILIVMGVSGSGKSTIGEALASRLNWPFHDGDSFHPPANVEKMRQGIPLNDTDRRPWLEAIREFMQHSHARNQNAVIACSALKSTYRDLLLQSEPWVRFIWLHGPRELIAERMQSRSDHFMPPSLLESQLNTLEPPANALVADISPSPDTIVETILSQLQGVNGADIARSE
jgi:gluconokinase